MWKLVEPIVLVHRLVLFLPDVHRFPGPLVHPVAFSVDHLGSVSQSMMLYQLPHIYNCLLSAALTPGGQALPYDKNSSGCRNVNNNQIKSCISKSLHNLLSCCFNLRVYSKTLHIFIYETIS